MFEPQVDAWYAWIAVSLVSLTVLCVATTATPSPPAQAGSAAETIDTVAASRPPASGTVPIDADRVRVEPRRVAIERETSRRGGSWRPTDTPAGVRSDAAPVRRGPITPATRGSPLREVALGAPPQTVFDSPRELEAAAATARDDETVLEPVDDELLVRSVEWEGVDVTVVAA